MRLQQTLSSTTKKIIRLSIAVFSISFLALHLHFNKKIKFTKKKEKRLKIKS